ncbi:MAG: hypothetical protein ABJA67_02445 [Chthonomonadales bacterium]
MPTPLQQPPVMAALQNSANMDDVSGARIMDTANSTKSLGPLQMLKIDLQRYNDYHYKVGSLKYWRFVVKQAYTHPGLLAVVVFRYGGWVRTVRIPVVRQILDAYYQYLYNWVRFRLQIEIPRDVAIGAGLRVDHYGGILINSQSVIGRNFTITQGVLLGQTESGAPVIGDDVNCGVGVKIIGGIKVGNCMKIGSGSIVTKSFPGKAVIAGVPAKELRKLLRAPERNGWIPGPDWVPEPGEEYPDA